LSTPPPSPLSDERSSLSWRARRARGKVAGLVFVPGRAAPCCSESVSVGPPVARGDLAPALRAAPSRALVAVTPHPQHSTSGHSELASSLSVTLGLPRPPASPPSPASSDTSQCASVGDRGGEEGEREGERGGEQKDTLPDAIVLRSPATPTLEPRLPLWSPRREPESPVDRGPGGGESLPLSPPVLSTLSRG
jgi:hypothetical protein